MELFDSSANIPIQRIQFPEIKDGPSFFIKRLDLIHPIYGGNKIFKLKYHIAKVQNEKIQAILSFGGPFSNHLYALAGLCQKLGIPCYGIVRGFEPYKENPNLQFCIKAGMQIFFLSPQYFNSALERNKIIEEIQKEIGPIHIIPEGGTDEMGILGASEMLSDNELNFDYYCIGVGSGGSISGLIRKTNGKGRVLGFSALKNGQYLEESINSYTKNYPKSWKLFHDYHFGGFAKQNKTLKDFERTFEANNDLEIDPVYQSKMLFGLEDLTKKHYFSIKDKVLIIHTGGLQAKNGFEYMAKK
ncbi:pyridoxal-phosphate dependent enzyme [Hyphobacterium sp. CCMP332]|nr:pyridoxal-phosphate dependent enzyme [Hyphobacterium sp. CCMP332]